MCLLTGHEVYVKHYYGNIICETKGESGFSLFSGTLIHKIEPKTTEWFIIWNDLYRMCYFMFYVLLTIYEVASATVIKSDSQLLHIFFSTTSGSVLFIMSWFFIFRVGRFEPLPIWNKRLTFIVKFYSYTKISIRTTVLKLLYTFAAIQVV